MGQPLPVIVSMGGVNGAGRTSMHHGTARMLEDALAAAPRQAMLASLRQLYGVRRHRGFRGAGAHVYPADRIQSLRPLLRCLESTPDHARSPPKLRTRAQAFARSPARATGNCGPAKMTGMCACRSSVSNSFCCRRSESSRSRRPVNCQRASIPRRCIPRAITRGVWPCRFTPPATRWAVWGWTGMF